MVCFTAVAVSVAVTFAPGMAAPLGSVMVPNKLPPSLAQERPSQQEKQGNAPCCNPIASWGVTRAEGLMTGRLLLKRLL